MEIWNWNCFSTPLLLYRCTLQHMACTCAILLLLAVLSPSMATTTTTTTTQAARSTVYRIACGANGNLTDSQSRTWNGDAGLSSTGSSFLNLGQSQDISANSSATYDPNSANLPDAIPYSTVRIFTAPSAYSFPVTPGRYYVRLYFYPLSFNASAFPAQNAIVSVKSDSFDLMTNVSLADLMASLNLAYVFKEYSINVTGTSLTLTFLPGSANGAFAMVNGVEIMAMPDDIFSSSLSFVGFGSSVAFPVARIAFETMFRLNMGGQTVRESEDELGRLWSTDLAFTVGAAYGVASSVSDPISYGKLPKYTAPADVYDSARFMTNDNNLNLQFNLSWSFEIDANFTYYVRLHFCELVYSLINMRVFDIYIDGETAFQGYDVVAFTGNKLIANVKDFAVRSSTMSTLSLQLHPSDVNSSYYNAILNGLEIYKMNNSAGSLQGPPPPPQVLQEQSPSSDGSTSTSQSSKMPIIGGVVGSLAAVAALAVIFFFCLRRRRSSAENSQKKQGSSKPPSWMPLPTNGGNSHSLATSKLSTTASRKSGTGSYASSAPSNNCRYFSFSEILEITGDFDETNVVGVGGFGKVYKGVLEDGTTEVAVKRGNPTSEQGVHEFQTEIELLSKLRHRHLVSLIGFCEDHSEMILVYDYMSNGPLRGHLYGAGLPPLSWKQRLEICIGAARGLHYLHTGAANGIIHRDVKTTNILLDENFVAKVADFGLSKTGPSLEHTHVSTAVKGSFGYLDPEYFRRQQLTEKSDVYSFGVVLLEVLLARPAINPTLPREQVNMAEWAMHHQKKGILDQIIDPSLKGRLNKDSLKKFAETAEKCLAESGLDRPAMGDILWNLEYALQLHETSPEKEWDSSNPKVKEIPVKDVPEVELPSMAEKKVDSNSHSSNTGFSENSDETTASAVFSQLINTQGR